MALVDIETGLGDHELAVRDAAHKFAAYFDGVSDWLADASRERSHGPQNPSQSSLVCSATEGVGASPILAAGQPQTSLGS